MIGDECAVSARARLLFFELLFQTAGRLALRAVIDSVDYAAVWLGASYSAGCVEPC